MGSLLCTHVWLYHVLWHCHIAPEFICPPCLIPGCLLCTFMNLSSIGHLLPEKPSFVAAEDLLWMVSSLLNQLLQLCWKYGSSFFISRHNLSSNFFFLFFFFLKDFIYLFLDRGEGRETERERNINVWLPLMCSALGTTGDLARNPGMCPNWELNQQPSDSQAGTQSTEPHQPRLLLYIFFYLFIYLFIF